MEDFESSVDTSLCRCGCRLTKRDVYGERDGIYIHGYCIVININQQNE